MRINNSVEVIAVAAEVMADESYVCPYIYSMFFTVFPGNLDFLIELKTKVSRESFEFYQAEYKKDSTG